VRVLLTEGSGLTSRQVATRLGELGHEVEILSSTPICLTRFTRHVRRVHRVPPFGNHPLAWLDAACGVARKRAVDLIFPTQEQVAVLSAFESRLPVPTVVPPFESLKRVQDKLSSFRTLSVVGLPQPPSLIAMTDGDLAAVTSFPVFVKRAVSTASSGVRRVKEPDRLAEVARSLEMNNGGVLVQSQVEGPLVMIQAIADGGRLIAWHANLRTREGASGGASSKESATLSGLADQLTALVGALRWHGPISLDAIVTTQGLMYIDVNPRLVEPRNALLAGVDLVAAMLALASGAHLRAAPVSVGGVRSHQLLLAILGIAGSVGRRRAIVREILQAARHGGPYAASVEELTPIRHDPLAAVPVALAAAVTLFWPRAGEWFSSSSVESYALTPTGWSEILRARGESAGGEGNHSAEGPLEPG